MLSEFSPADPALDARLGSSHQRFARLVAEADVKARPFYARIFGEALGAEQAIERIFADIERDGDSAVLRYGKLFDQVELSADRLRVPAAVCAAAWKAASPALQSALKMAIAQVRRYQRGLLRKSYVKGGLGVRFTPLERVGAYVPGGAGGNLPLVSTVVMNLLPAAVAGVDRLVLCTPPRSDGLPHPALLAAAHAVGVHEVYAVGGVQAIAAMACGTSSIARVDKIVGPGNVFVTLAKRRAYGRVDIDMLAGPSEVLVMSDGSVDPAWVAADLLSQAEHDPLAMPVLLGLGAKAIAPVQAELRRQCAELPDARRPAAEASLANMGLAVSCSSKAQALAIANRIAAEHVELLVRQPKSWIAGLRHAGAIFVGPWSPEAIGDYVAGPSHTLPTGGSARAWSGIGADTFLRRTSIIALERPAFSKLAKAGMALADAEGLRAHERSIACRLKPLKKTPR